MQELSKYFSMPEKTVAKQLGICLTSLKKICRQNGINRWPYRKVRPHPRFPLVRSVPCLLRLTGARAAVAVKTRAARCSQRHPQPRPGTLTQPAILNLCRSRVWTRSYGS
jgi:hypothetical protein